ncbi:protein brambleberry [Entelurus aequoreus]|uniref:protein brambleberry n=1 Tax=Entelurus aequoreus TaxID=161455 RepID=UPI002B1D2B5C|nr:protein brambleberry [Entelurus aequoreus]
MERLLRHLKFLLLLIILANQCPAACGLFEWLKQAERPPAAAEPLPPAAAEPLPPAAAEPHPPAAVEPHPPAAAEPLPPAAAEPHPPAAAEPLPPAAAEPHPPAAAEPLPPAAAEPLPPAAAEPLPPAAAELLPPPAAEPLPPAAQLSTVILAKDAPFEMATADEKFLAEAKQMALSPLDTCHQRVVSRLTASCDSLSEEELAKLGVVLFNCQARIEGRTVYPCADHMAIRECTANMDATTWNAYHIVSNRARSVCYAIRQQLFRRRAEHTVNTLISTAANQLSAMEDLKDGQLELRQMTAASLDKLLKGHSALQSQQVKLHDGQEQMESSLRDNLQRLSQEKALIASGQQLVAELIGGITERMEMVSEDVQVHGSKVQDGHKAIVQDLADVRHQAQDIYQKIDDGMSEFLRYQDQTSQYYNDVTRKLERMNSSLGFMLHYLDNMQTRMEERLHVIQGYLGWAGLSLAAMWTCLAHSSYFVLLAVLQSFLRCPVFPRAILLVTVPLNALAEINCQPALHLTSLSYLLFVLSLGHWLVSKLWACSQSRGKKTMAPPCYLPAPQTDVASSDVHPRTSTPQKSSSEQDDLMTQDSFVSAVKPPPVHLQVTNHYPPRFIPKSAFIDDIPLRTRGDVFDILNTRSASPTPSVNSSVSGRQLCNAVTKTGKACKKRALLGQEYCRVHDNGNTTSFYS